MSFEASLVVATFIIVASIVALMAVVQSRKRAAAEDDMKNAASTRGWKFESLSEKGCRVHRWTGSTDGIPWTAESITQVSGGTHSRHRTHIARWHGAWNPGINGAIVVMSVPKGKEHIATAMAQSDSFIAKMAQKAVSFALDKAIDVYFGEGPGKEVDAGAMHRVDEQKVPGFIVMATDKEEGTRVLSQGLEKALLDASANTSSVFSDEDRPSILLRPNAISLARTAAYHDVAELDRFIRAGVSLTRAFKFGRVTS